MVRATSLTSKLGRGTTRGIEILLAAAVNELKVVTTFGAVFGRRQRSLDTPVQIPGFLTGTALLAAVSNLN